MTPGQFKVCTACPRQDLSGWYTGEGTDHLGPMTLMDDLIGEYLRDGWTVTYHDHERTP